MTQLLRNMLRIKSFRKLFLEMLDEPIEIDDWSNDYFDTQYNTTKNGRPDLVYINTETIVIYEIKVSEAVLTSNQPEGYYRELFDSKDHKRRILVLLVQKGYYDLNNYHKRLAAVKQEKDSIITKTIFWEEIAEQLSESGLIDTSPVLLEFYKFLNDWFTPNVILNSNDMEIIFNKSLPQSLGKLTMFIDQIAADFLKLGYTNKFQGSSHWEQYGYYFILPNEETLFFGIWWDYWEESGSPFCISVEEPSTEAIEKFQEVVSSKGLSTISDFEDCVTTHPAKSVFEGDESKKRVVEIIKAFLDGFEVKISD